MEFWKARFGSKSSVGQAWKWSLTHHWSYPCNKKNSGACLDDFREGLAILHFRLENRSIGFLGKRLRVDKYPAPYLKWREKVGCFPSSLFPMGLSFLPRGQPASGCLQHLAWWDAFTLLRLPGWLRFLWRCSEHQWEAPLVGASALHLCRYHSAEEETSRIKGAGRGEGKCRPIKWNSSWWAWKKYRLKGPTKRVLLCAQTVLNSNSQEWLKYFWNRRDAIGAVVFQEKTWSLIFIYLLHICRIWYKFSSPHLKSFWKGTKAVYCNNSYDFCVSCPILPKPLSHDTTNYLLFCILHHSTAADLKHGHDAPELNKRT